MSGGLEDMAALGRQEQKVRETAHALAVALREALEGHRGWSIKHGDLADIVDGYLSDEGVPFGLRKVSP
jgi:hypothetical protein